MKNSIIVANWKMNGTISEANQYLNIFLENTKNENENEIIFCPPFTLLNEFGKLLANTNIKTGAQNCYYKQKGSFTGEISAMQIKDLDCDYVILGHSERRMYFNETNEIVKQKAQIAIDNNLIPIICIGETEYELENNLTEKILKQQLLGSIPEELENENFIIAYEPVWAIGTGKIPSQRNIKEVNDFIIKILQEELNLKDKPAILYGGSVNADNYKEILNIDNVNGLLVGSASLNAEVFLKICND